MNESVKSMLNCSVGDNLNFTVEDIPSGSLTGGGTFYSCWDYWHQHYYPDVIHYSYPVYIQEKALDKGKQAFEIIKILTVKKLVQISKVKDFIDIMDELIKIL